VNEQFIVRKGDSAEDPFALVITPKTAGWEYSSLRILELPPGGSSSTRSEL
jgi:5-deoxy-glucuronate isomerase